MNLTVNKRTPECHERGRKVTSHNEELKTIVLTHLRGTENPDSGVGMGGGSFTSSHRTSFGQGKRMTGVHEDVRDKHRGREKNHLQSR